MPALWLAADPDGKQNNGMEWTPKADALVRVVHPTIVAERLDVSLESVLARRTEVGLPTIEHQFARRKKHRSGGIKRLSPESVEIIRTNSIAVAAKLLGKSPLSICRYRQTLGIARPRKYRRHSS
jgi:hypothetical protein